MSRTRQGVCLLYKVIANFSGNFLSDILIAFAIMPKMVLITGANRGIGFCMVQRIAQRAEDCCVLVASRDVSAAEEAISHLNELKAATLQPVALDVTSDESIRTCLENIKNQHGRLDGEYRNTNSWVLS